MLDSFALHIQHILDYDKNNEIWIHASPSITHRTPSNMLDEMSDEMLDGERKRIQHFIQHRPTSCSRNLLF